MKMKFTRALCLLLCLLMLVPFSLTACGGGGDGDGDETTKKPDSTTAPEGDGGEDVDLENPNFEDWVEIYDMGIDGGARQINFLTYSDFNERFYFFRHEGDADLDNGDALAISAGSRTMLMEEKYKVAFNVIGTGTIDSALQSSVMGNGGEYDLIYPHPTVGMNTLLTNGLMQNLYNFEAIDLSKPWWTQAQVQAYSMDDWLVMATNQMSICGQNMMAIVYNKDIYSEQKIGEDLYGMVYEGQWTIGQLKTMAMKYGEGAGDDQVLDQNDKCGMFSEGHASYYWAFGGRIFDKDESGEFYIAVDGTHADQMAKALHDFLWVNEDKIWKIEDPSNNANFGSSKVLASFKQGNALFYAYDLGALYKHLWNCGFDVGYLPFPMLNTDQDDYYAVSSTGFFGIPQKVVDKRASSTILEALAIHSYTNHRKTFFETILLSRMSDNPEDYKMLSFIHDTKIWDWGNRHIVEHERSDAPSSHNFLLYYVVYKKEASVSNYVNSRKKLWNRLLDDLNKIRNSKLEA
ncbi:MAG: extracellular solute-binding protein [Clostridia bacterium]|nr:extracellular solute-binding protein [Clostridia bacterium]